jgi:hypothetical protein
MLAEMRGMTASITHHHSCATVRFYTRVYLSRLQIVAINQNLENSVRKNHHDSIIRFCLEHCCISFVTCINIRICNPFILSDRCNTQSTYYIFKFFLACLWFIRPSASGWYL